MRLLISLWVVFWIRDGLEGGENVLIRRERCGSVTTRACVHACNVKVAHISSLIQEGLVIAVIVKGDRRWDPLLVIQVGKVMEQLYKIMLVDNGLVFFKNNISTRCFCTQESIE